MDHAPDTDTGQRMACPECGEPAIPADRLIRRPDTHLPGGSNPAWVHTDGEPLCPVIGDDGYEPAQPVPAVPAAEAAQAAEVPAAEPDTYTIEVCDDCAQVIVNGEINDGTDRGQEIAAAQTRLWGADAVNLVLACGGDECDTAFSWSRCDGCGSTLGGNRHPASVRTNTAAEAAQAAEVPAGDGSRLVCPGCGQPVQRHPRWREEPGLYTTLGINRDWIHPDGSPLCSMPGVHYLDPARPVPAAAAGAGERQAVMPAGEVAGLEDAIAFGEAMEQRLRQAAIATEQSVANLAAAGVTGDTVTVLTSAAHTLAGAVLAFSSVTQGLRRQLLVRDAYHAAPGAGDRDFLTRE